MVVGLWFHSICNKTAYRWPQKVSDYAFFKNWNDLHLVIMVARHRSFASAAEALGVNQVTIAKRLFDLELTLGRRLFTRRRAGAAPTEFCLEILAQANSVAEAMQRVEDGLKRARTLKPSVTIGASEGMLNYTIKPALQSATEGAHPIDVRRISREALPPLKFTSDLRAADVSLWLTPEDAPPAIRGAYHVRRLGAVSFRPFAGQKLVREQGFRCDRFDDLKLAPLIDMGAYKLWNSLSEWNGVTAENSQTITFDTTKEMLASEASNYSVMLLPNYSLFYEKHISPLEISRPRLAVSLWLSSHEDALREPEVRKVFDTLGEAFEHSPWFH